MYLSVLDRSTVTIVADGYEGVGDDNELGIIARSESYEFWCYRISWWDRNFTGSATV